MKVKSNKGESTFIKIGLVGSASSKVMVALVGAIAHKFSKLDISFSDSQHLCRKLSDLDFGIGSPSARMAVAGISE